MLTRCCRPFRPDFKTIIPAQYGQHVVLKMIVRDDMRAWFVDQLVELLDDREFLRTRGGTRVLEQAFKSFSRDQCRLVYDKLAEVMNGNWLECALSIVSRVATPTAALPLQPTLSLLTPFPTLFLAIRRTAA